MAKKTETIKVYTATEVCDILKIARRTLYRYVDEGKIAGFRAGRQYRFTQDDIKAYMDATHGQRMYNKKSDYWEARKAK